MIHTAHLPSILAAAAAAFIVGFLWHGPLFGRLWVKLMQFPQLEVDAMNADGMKEMGPKLLASYIQQFIKAYALLTFINMMSIPDIAGAITLAGFVWLAFIATTLFNAVLWERRSFALYILNVSYHLAALVAIVIVLTLMK